MQQIDKKMQNLSQITPLCKNHNIGGKKQTGRTGEANSEIHIGCFKIGQFQIGCFKIDKFNHESEVSHVLCSLST